MPKSTALILAVKFGLLVVVTTPLYALAGPASDSSESAGRPVPTLPQNVPGPASALPYFAAGAAPAARAAPSSAQRKRLRLAKKRKRLVKIALRYRGVRYRWAGTSPRTGFDCSGFTRYVYKKMGVRLPHSSRAQVRKGRKVSVRHLKPGDLVFRGRPVHHVGIYIGRGRVVEAPRRGQRVKIRKLSQVSHARRILLSK